MSTGSRSVQRRKTVMRGVPMTPDSEAGPVGREAILDERVASALKVAFDSHAADAPDDAPTINFDPVEGVAFARRLIRSLADSGVALVATPAQPAPSGLDALGNDKGGEYAAIRRVESVLDEAVLSGALSPEERRSVRLAATTAPAAEELTPEQHAAALNRWRRTGATAPAADEGLRCKGAPAPGRWAFLNPETGDWIEVKAGTVHIREREQSAALRDPS